MFPIRAHNPSTRRPYVVYGLIVINVAVFVVCWLTIPNETALQGFFYNWGLVPARVSAGFGLSTLLTSMFLHGGWLHIIGNMLFLWIFGDNLEDEMGHVKFAAFYLGAGLAAAFLQIAGDPESYSPMIGASGAIAGVMGGYLLLYPKARVDVLFIFIIFFRIFAIPAWIVLGIWFGVQIYSGSQASMLGDGVAHLAHIGGFVGGLVLTFPLWLRRGGTAYWRQNQGRPANPETQFKLSKTTIPAVLRRK